MSISVSSCASRCSRRALDLEHLEHLLLLLELERQVRGDGVGQAPGLVDAGERGQDLGRDLLVQLHVLVELREQRAAHRLDLGGPASVGRRSASTSATQWSRRSVTRARCARAAALDQHLHRAVGQLEHLQDAGDAADVVHVLGARLVLGRRLLRDQQDVLARFHRGFHRLDGLRAADEQRDHHVREHHHVAQRQQRETRRVGRERCRGHAALPGWMSDSRTWGRGGGMSSRRRKRQREARERRLTSCAAATFGWSAIDQQRLAVGRDHLPRRPPPC